MNRFAYIFKLKDVDHIVSANFLADRINDSTAFVSPWKKVGLLIKQLVSFSFSGLLYGKIAKFLLEQSKSNRITECSPKGSFSIKISTGCLGTCTFCAVRLSRGKLKSKSIEAVKKEFDEGLQKGFSEFYLIGTDIGSYGRDIGTNLAVLLNELISRHGDYAIMLRNFEPKYLIEMYSELKPIFESGKISCISTAVQSGSDRILSLMNRQYKIQDFKNIVMSIKNDFPGIKIRTQMMVGFPTETYEEFGQTMRLVDELDFDYIEVYKFQPRPNTKASRLEGHISRKTANKRYRILLTKILFNQFHT